MSPSIFSEYLALPKNSPQHQLLREQLWLGGVMHECQYYLSVLLERDFFACSTEEFLKEVRLYLSQKCGPEAVQFCSGIGDLNAVLPFLKQRYQETEGHVSLSKEERALVLLLQNSSWSDEQIRTAVRTTERQMRRWPSYKIARRTQKRADPRR
jgi:hypothetical protein